MKKTYFYGIASAAFIVGSIGLASCSSDQSLSDENVGGDGTPRKEVKTTLAITVEDGGDDATTKMGTRMSADATQNYIKKDKTVATFHHFYNMAMMTFATPSGSTATDWAPGADNAWTKLIKLGNSTSKANSKDSNQRQLYIDIAVPTETSDVLFYAMGPQDGLTEKSTSFPISKENNGVLNTEYYSDNNAPTNPSGINFTLEKRYTGSSLANESNAQKIVTQLNKLMNIKGILAAKDTTEIVANDADYNKITADTKEEQARLRHEYMVKKVYVTFKGMSYDKTKYGDGSPVKILEEMRDELKKLSSGSALAVKSTLQGLQTNLPRVGVVKNDDATKATQGSFLYWQLYQEVKKALEELADNTFPTDQCLPEGAVKLTYNVDATNGPFAYATGADNTSIVTGDYTIDNSKVTYPASLAYFCNTKVMTSKNPISDMSNELPDVSNWKNADWSGVSSNWSQTAVDQNTQSIALKDAIIYGVSQLKTTVKCKAAKLKDHKWVEGTSKDEDMIEVPVDGYTLTGVLVGGQPDKVDWQFLPTSDANFDHTIYDSYMNTADDMSAANDDGTAKAAGAIAAKYNASKLTPNYTLVLDNKNSATSGTANKTVYIALEFLNTGNVFYGKDGGMIPNGSKFYLVGKLDPTATSGVSKPDGVAEGTLDHVFVKGYTTAANFVIGETSLQKATNTIPDLRTAELSLGLMVDFTWKDGLTFDDVELE